ncbi:hypothetical protein ACFL3V_05370 [Nanoarchaeota archaeon]
MAEEKSSGKEVKSIKTIDSDNSELDTIRKRMDEQQQKLDSIWNLVSDKKKVEQIVDENHTMKKLITEKDSLLKILKDKLTEKATLLKQLEDNTRDTVNDIDNYKKQIFSLQNKIGAVEKRVFSTDEQNQKVLYEFMKNKERLQQIETDLAERDRIIAKMKEAHSRNIEAFQRDSAEKKMLLMKNHSKKITVMTAALDMLKTRIEQQNRLIKNKSVKESRLIKEFNSQMQDIITAKNDLSIDTSVIPSDTDEMTEEAAERPSEALSQITESLVTEPAPEASASAEVISEPESRSAEIVPIIELALDHGDTLDSIKHSLLSSGYSENDIDEAVSGLDIVEQVNKKEL